LDIREINSHGQCHWSLTGRNRNRTRRGSAPLARRLSIEIYGVRVHTAASRIEEAIGVATRCAEPVMRKGMRRASNGSLVGLIEIFAAGGLVAALLLGARDPAGFVTVDDVVTLVAFVSAAIRTG
jgi:hypothetical protein